jgi:hypothetical protein
MIRGSMQVSFLDTHPVSTMQFDRNVLRIPGKIRVRGKYLQSVADGRRAN